MFVFEYISHPETSKFSQSVLKFTEQTKKKTKLNLKILSKAHYAVYVITCKCLIENCLKLQEYKHSLGTTFIKTLIIH